MEYPKMLYSTAASFANYAAVGAALAERKIATLVVKSEDEEIAADGFTADIASLIAAPKKTKAA